jgi:hypothetical protein
MESYEELKHSMNKSQFMHERREFDSIDNYISSSKYSDLTYYPICKLNIISEQVTYIDKDVDAVIMNNYKLPLHEDIRLILINNSIPDEFPSNLNVIIFGTHFNHSLEYVKWTHNINTLLFNDVFNNVLTLPIRIKKLWLGLNYLHHIDVDNTLLFELKIHTQYIDAIPKSVQILHLGSRFNETLNRNQFPLLHTLILSECYNQSFNSNSLPEYLDTLHFNDIYDQYIRYLPQYLRRIKIGSKYTKSVADVEWPNKLHIIYDKSHSITIDASNFPPSLQKIYWPSGQVYQNNN